MYRSSVVKAKLTLFLVFVAVFAAGLAILVSRGPSSKSNTPTPEPAQQSAAALVTKPSGATEPELSAPVAGPAPVARVENQPEIVPAATNRVEVLARLREQFRALAAGDAKAAMAAAKGLTNEVERETALLTLVTEWTHGELSPPRARATAISTFGLEAGMGMELVNNPQLAVLWANEMTQGPARLALLEQTAAALLDSDPAAAFELIHQVAPGEQRQFVNALYASWASTDTDAALRAADQIQDPAEHDAALQAIRSTAPVGIGAELRTQDGYPVINGLVPGTPAEASGQLHKGDRIVALAQGENAFVDTHNVSLGDIVQMIRGAPGTMVQLQVLPADAAPDSPPRTVAIWRDQLKFKR
jgi:hypothetical protein